MNNEELEKELEIYKIALKECVEYSNYLCGSFSENETFYLDRAKYAVDKLHLNKRMEWQDKQGKEYYEANFEKIILECIDKNEQLTAEEFKRLVGNFVIEESAMIDRKRTYIIELKGRFFSINFENGYLSDFYSPPVEVVKKMQWVAKR